MTYFHPHVYAGLLLLAAITAIGCSLVTIRAVHDAGKARQQVCLAKLEALRARNPFLERYVMPSAPCLALDVVTDSGPR